MWSWDFWMNRKKNNYAKNNFGCVCTDVCRCETTMSLHKFFQPLSANLPSSQDAGFGEALTAQANSAVQEELETAHGKKRKRYTAFSDKQISVNTPMKTATTISWKCIVRTCPTLVKALCMYLSLLCKKRQGERLRQSLLLFPPKAVHEIPTDVIIILDQTGIHLAPAG